MFSKNEISWTKLQKTDKYHILIATSTDYQYLTLFSVITKYSKIITLLQ